MDANRLAAYAQRQQGLFTRDQARRCGFSAYRIRRRLQSGEWLAVLGPVFAGSGLVVTSEVRDRAAQLAVPGSILAGPSAARRWRMPVPDGSPHLFVGPRNHPRIDGVRLHFTTPDAADVGRHGSVPVTWRERTVYDCLLVLPERAAADLLDRALQQSWTTVDDLDRRVRRHGSRRGAARLRRLVAGVRTGERSAAERLAVALLRTAGLTGWTVNTPLHDAAGLIGVGDIVSRDTRVLVELDGRAFHVSPESFQRDRERQNRLVAAGWMVLRFTWHDLTQRPGAVVAQIRAALARP